MKMYSIKKIVTVDKIKRSKWLTIDIVAITFGQRPLPNDIKSSEYLATFVARLIKDSFPSPFFLGD